MMPTDMQSARVQVKPAVRRSSRWVPVQPGEAVPETVQAMQGWPMSDKYRNVDVYQEHGYTVSIATGALFRWQPPTSTLQDAAMACVQAESALLRHYSRLVGSGRRA